METFSHVFHIRLHQVRSSKKLRCRNLLWISCPCASMTTKAFICCTGQQYPHPTRNPVAAKHRNSINMYDIRSHFRTNCGDLRTILQQPTSIYLIKKQHTGLPVPRRRSFLTPLRAIPSSTFGSITVPVGPKWILSAKTEYRAILPALVQL